MSWKQIIYEFIRL